MSLLILGELLEGECGDLELSTCTLTVGGCDQRSVEVIETTIVEELMDGECQGMTDAEHGAEGVGARTQVSLLAEEFQGVTLLLQRIGQRIGSAIYMERFGLNLHGLTLALRCH